MFSTLHKRFVRGTIIKPEAPSISLPPTQSLPPLPAAITPDKNNSTAAAERRGKREVVKFCHQSHEQVKKKIHCFASS